MIYQRNYLDDSKERKVATYTTSLNYNVALQKRKKNVLFFWINTELSNLQ